MVKIIHDIVDLSVFKYGKKSEVDLLGLSELLRKLNKIA